MKITIEYNHNTYRVDTSKPIGISTTISSGGSSPNAYFLPAPDIKPFAGENFVLTVESGAPVNCETLLLAPHGNGTHAECVGHISKERVFIADVMKEFLFVAHVVTVTPTQQESDYIITKEELATVLPDIIPPVVVIRTLPNNPDKPSRNWSGTNPVYLEADAALLCNQHGVQHLVVDFPSVDREEDGGMLQAHHAFWGYPENTRHHATITEMAYIPNEVPDGMYLIQFHIIDVESDASPAKLVLYNLENV